MTAAIKSSYKLYAALHEDIAEGFVWFKCDNLPARCIVKITYEDDSHCRRSVCCEALKLDKNFLELYNKKHCNHQPQYRIEGAESLATSMVINHWYRARLGPPKAPLKTQEKYVFEIKAFDRWYNKSLGKLRACTGHPQVVVRVGVWLGIISVWLGVLGVIISLGLPWLGLLISLLGALGLLISLKS